MFGLGAGELVIVALVFVLLFGPKKVPDLARGIGEVIQYTRKAFSDADSDAEMVDDEEKGRRK